MAFLSDLKALARHAAAVAEDARNRSAEPAKNRISMEFDAVAGNLDEFAAALEEKTHSQGRITQSMRALWENTYANDAWLALVAENSMVSEAIHEFFKTYKKLMGGSVEEEIASPPIMPGQPAFNAHAISDGIPSVAGLSDPAQAASGAGKTSSERRFIGFAPLFSLQLTPLDISSIDMNKDGQLALLGGGNSVFLLTGDKPVREFKGHQEGVQDVRFGFHGVFMVSCEGPRIHIWETISGRNVHVLADGQDPVECCEMSPNSRFILSGQGRNLKLWDIPSGTCIRRFEGHENTLTGVWFSPDGEQAYSASRDHTFRVWDVQTGVCLRTILTGQDDQFKPMEVRPDEGLGIVASDSIVEVWDLKNGTKISACIWKDIFRDYMLMGSIYLCKDGRHLITGSIDIGQGEGKSLSNDTRLRLWDLKAGVCLGHMDIERPPHDFGINRVMGICASEDESQILIGTNAGFLAKYAMTWETGPLPSSNYVQDASPYLRIFLRRLKDRTGNTNWSATDFSDLLKTLKISGYGSIRPDEIERELKSMAFYGRY